MTQRKNIKYQKRPDGSTILYDENRNVIGTQKPNKRNQLRMAQGKKPIDFSGITRYYWRKNKNGVPLFVQADMDAENLPDDFQLFPKTEAMMMAVIQLVADGKTLRKIGQIAGMPPISIVMKWARDDEDFASMLTEARKSRAEVYHDAIEEVAFQTKEGTAKSSKVKIDALKFLASVNDRDRFGHSKDVQGGGTVVNFVVNTGIADQPIAVEGKVIDVEATEEPAAGDSDGVQPEATPARDPLQTEKV